MTETNSEKYWDNRFVENWEIDKGPDQSRFFSQIAIENLPGWLMKQLISQSLTFADWGCAQGDGTEIWAKYIGAKCVTGVDFSSAAIDQAINRYPSVSFINDNWLTKDARIDRLFDIVFSSNTLEHFHTPYDVLNAVCPRAKKALILILPYRELNRIEEHFYSFHPDNIPVVIANGFRLIWAKVVDCFSMPNSCWPGEEIILVFANSNWVDGLGLTLDDIKIEQNFVIDSINLKSIYAERDIANAEHEAAIAERDAAIAERDAADLMLRKLKSSSSWGLTRPLRIAARFARYGISCEDGKRLHQTLRIYYHRLPMPVQVKKIVRYLYHSFGEKIARKLRKATQPIHKFKPPELKPAPKNKNFPDYIVFGVIDWHFRHQRPQQISLALIQTNRRVFYVSPSLISDERGGFKIEALDDSGLLFQIQLFVKEAHDIYSSSADFDTTFQLQNSLGEMLDWASCEQIVSIVQHPFWYEIASVLPNSRLIYDCMDHHEGFGNNNESLLQLEKCLLREAELTITTSSWLNETVAPEVNRQVLIRNAGDYDHFSKAPNSVYRDPQNRKVIGYYGAIAEWFDLDLVEDIARHHPNCCILLIGADTVNAQGRLGKLPNVIFTGEVAYSKLPYYLHGFDVCLLPFKIIPLTLATNPVKAYEYLSSGKPIVAVDLPEMSQFDGLVYKSSDRTHFLEIISMVLAQSEPADLIQRRKTFATGQTWKHRCDELIRHVESVVYDPKVSIVIVTYNNLDLTRTCLASLDEHSQYEHHEIIIVDNASSDGSQEFLNVWADNHHNCKLILNNDNKGFAAANNQGLAVANGDFFVLLNNDTYVTPGWIRTLIKHLLFDKTIGLIGPVTNNIGNEAKIDIEYIDMKEMLSKSAAFTRRHIGQLFPLRSVAFFCVMLPRDTYVRIGPLDEVFGRGYFEDDDYCRRVEQAGMRIMCAEDVFIHHNLSSSFNKINKKERQKLFEENKKIYEGKWGPWVPHEYRKNSENSISYERIPQTFTNQKCINGRCNVCGKATRFFYKEESLWRESLNCEFCRTTSRYRSIACGILSAIEELTGICANSLTQLPRISKKKLHVYDTQLPFYYNLCAYPLPDMLKETGWIDVELSQFEMKVPQGKVFGKGVTNQNLECLTYENESFDIVITSDVMEHVRLDDRAHKEIYRVLKTGGIYIFTVPHNRSWEKTVVRVQVTDPDDSLKDVYLLDPEYHEDTNNNEGTGALSYRTYGLDLEGALSELGFEVKYYHKNSTLNGILNTELYVCQKISPLNV